MAMAAAKRLTALRANAVYGNRFYAAVPQIDANDLAEEMEESSKWKKITIFMVTVATSYGIYVKTHEEHPPKREKDMPYMNVRKKEFPWGPDPLFGYPWVRHPERYQDGHGHGHGHDH